MSESGFNSNVPLEVESRRDILLPFRSTRYLYYKSRRLGLLQFVKRPAPEFENDMLTVEALRKEFLLCYPLSHPSVVRYLRFEDNALYEEYIDGDNLGEMLKNNDPRLKNPDFLRSLSIQLFEALDYIHRQGILHLDIKPENLMATRIGNNLKIIDFSCAVSASLDSTGGFTDEYKVPEQGETAADCTADIYQAGRVIQILAAHANRSGEWKKFLGKALAEKPEARFQSAGEALAALQFPKPRGAGSVSRMFLVAAVLISVVAVIWFAGKYFVSGSEDTVPVSPSPVESSAVAATVTGLQEGTPVTPNSPSDIRAPKAVREAAPAPAAVSTSYAPDIRSRLEKEINSHIRNYFQSKVFPLFNDTARFPEGPQSRKFLDVAGKAVRDGLDDAESFGESLCRRYPEQEDFIRTQVMTAFSAQNNIFNGKIYR